VAVYIGRLLFHEKNQDSTPSIPNFRHQRITYRTNRMIAMRQLYFLIVSMLFIGTLETSAQVETIAYVWELTPRLGHGEMVADALHEHMQWRIANGDTWNWDIFEVVTGSDYGSFYARSGSHTWADIDNYSLEGASEHFNSTVVPHLESLTNTITQGLPELTNMPPPDDMSLYHLVFYDVIPSKQGQMMKAIGKFSEIISEKAPDQYHAFATIVAGGDGSSVLGVFPRASWAEFEESDPSIEQMLSEALGPEGAQELFMEFTTSIRGETNSILMHRKDLSSMWIE